MIKPQSANLGADRQVAGGVIEAAFFRGGGGNGGPDANGGPKAAT